MSTSESRPRVGFAGTGWIGRNRMQAVLDGGLVEPVAICDPSPQMLEEAAKLAPAATRYATFDAMLEDAALDAVVIATPSAQHAAQSLSALERDLCVFCQKPLGRSGDEVEAVVDAARRMDRLLGVDLSYRYTDAMQAIRSQVEAHALGEIFAVDLVFHNAYGPDKPWFYDKAQSGGGCLIDLGVHLIDLAGWTLGFPRLIDAVSDLRTRGRPVGASDVEDFVIATLRFEGGISVRLACSWHLHAGQDAVISASFYGTEGAAVFHNLKGSFYHFEAFRNQGTRRDSLAGPDEWGGKAICAWAQALQRGKVFDPAARHYVDVARILDAIYHASPRSGHDG